MKLKVSNIVKKIAEVSKLKLLVFFLFLILFGIFLNSLPSPLFNKPFSVIVEDKDGNLLNALIAKDGQWRFPVQEKIPEKFKVAITQFEDKRFYYHPGVDIIALLRAAYQDITAGKIKSGGSTITMQVIRIAREGKPRTFTEKIIEIILALRLELTYSKKEIMSFYAAYSPFGGNVVGIEAAAWRYFGRKPEQLSWAEVCMLAVLPNSPSLVHPGKNRKLLKKKRDRLLKRLYKNDKIDSLTYSLAIEEPLPDKLKSLPNLAPHLTFEIAKKFAKNKNSKNSRVKSTLDINVQKRVNNIIQKHYKRLKTNYVYNAAAVVADIETGNVLAYVGNTRDSKNRNENWVDVVTAPRSSGSILKPILYAAMLSNGELLPKTLIPDIPTQIGGFSPKNFNLSYDGAVPANRALARSINIPAVRLLRSYRVERFYNLLKNLGITTLSRPSYNYGLSLILGGAEVKLWEIAGVYASMARVLKHYTKYGMMYSDKDFHSLRYISVDEKNTTSNDLVDYSYFSRAALWLTFNALLDVERPNNQSYWREFSSSQKIAWKTGTSFGFRDGWAIGIDKDYLVAVWTGNADGEGRTGLTGISSAAPILFDIFNILPFSAAWFEQPNEEMTYVATCKESGYRASELCEDVDSIWIPKAGLKFPVCPYHHLIHLDSSGKYRVTSSCVSPSKMIHKSWFVLPPAMEYFYKNKNHGYKVLPPFRNDCIDNLITNNPMELIYPRDVGKIYIPVNLDGTSSSTIFEVAHRRPDSKIYWYVDKKYLGETKSLNKMSIDASKGNHILTLVDDEGYILTKKFEILNETN